MMLGKIVLLVSVSSLALAGAAMAADLPSKKSAPVESLRICSVGDAGGFVIPGSTTCLRIAGRVRAEYLYAEPFSRSANTTSMRARGYVTLDAASDTDLGPLRTSARIVATRESGRGFNAAGVNGANIINAAATTNADIGLDWAYVQLGNLTAGRVATSFFEFAPFSGLSYDGGGLLGRGADYGAINTIAYSVTAGSVVATLALEDGTERRVGLAQTTGAFTPTYGGHVVPDLVGRLDLTESWGQFALTGAVHQSRTGKVADNAFTGGAVGETAYGFAVQAGLKVNLPSLGTGDALFLQAAYATGANSYTGWGGTGAGTLAPQSYDVAYDAAGKAKLSDSWSVTGGLLHYWTPSLRQGVFAAWGRLDQFGPSNDVAAVSAGTNLIWTPVRNLDVGAEVVYAKLTQTPRSLLPLQAFDQRDSWSGRVRFERDF